MTSSAGAIPRPPRWLRHVLYRPGNWLPAVFWLFLVLFQASKAFSQPSVSTFGLLMINAVALVLFLTRRDASRVGAFWEGLLAVGGTFVMSLLLIAAKNDGGVLHDAPLLPTLIQAVGILGWAVSLLALGRSLGVAPADRGLVRRGPYRFIRHPIYAFELLFSIGWLVAEPTPINAAIIAVWWAFQVARVIREERIIGGYDQYRQEVRWRVIPFVW